MSSRPRPHLRTFPVRPSLDDAEGPDFALLLTQTLRADLRRGAASGSGDIASRVVERLRRDPGVIGERVRCASDRHRRLRSAAGRVTAAVLVIALAIVAGRIEPAPRNAMPTTPSESISQPAPSVESTPQPGTQDANPQSPPTRRDDHRSTSS